MYTLFAVLAKLGLFTPRPGFLPQVNLFLYNYPYEG
jgi:hypothetical protein